MPKVEVVGYGTIEVPAGTRLVNAILSTGADIGHRCGGYAACTTCRVAFHEGEPVQMTLAERAKLSDVKLLGQVRLSCQVEVDRDMRVRPLMLVSEQEWSDGGPQPEDRITPEPEWTGG